jgi:predicted ArsR family transcriptional regulator
MDSLAAKSGASPPDSPDAVATGAQPARAASALRSESVARAEPSARRPGATRARLLGLLKAGGPASASRLAAALGVTPMAARQHLLALQAEGRVAHAVQRGAVGRPTKLWRLTPLAEDAPPETAPGFADGHGQLVAELLACLEPKALGAALALREKRLAKLYGRGLDKRAPLRLRLEALARRRTAEGYMAGLEVSPDGWYLLVQNHCPIRAAACACPALCDSEARVFRKALGKDVAIERREHRLSGDRRCTFAIRKTKAG